MPGDYRQTVYDNLKQAYGDNFNRSYEDFSKKLDTDPTYSTVVYKNLQQAYGNDFKRSQDEFQSMVNPNTTPQDSTTGSNNVAPPSQPQSGGQPSFGGGQISGGGGAGASWDDNAPQGNGLPPVQIPIKLGGGNEQPLNFSGESLIRQKAASGSPTVVTTNGMRIPKPISPQQTIGVDDNAFKTPPADINVAEQNNQNIQEGKAKLQQNPNDNDAIAQIGYGYKEIGDFANAKNAFLNVLQKDPTNQMALTNMGAISYGEKKYEEAYNNYTQALKANPQNGNAALGISQSLLALSKKVPDENGDGINPSDYETKLSPDKEREFQSWLDTQHKEGKINETDYTYYKQKGYGYDYDFRAAFESGVKPELNKEDGLWHWNDIGKKPNEPTFSNQSKYNGVNGNVGGTWDGDTFVPNPNKLTKEQLLQQAKGIVDHVVSGDDATVPTEQTAWQVKGLIESDLGNQDEAKKSFDNANIAKTVSTPVSTLNDWYAEQRRQQAQASTPEQMLETATKALTDVIGNTAEAVVTTPIALMATGLDKMYAGSKQANEALIKLADIPQRIKDYNPKGSEDWSDDEKNLMKGSLKVVSGGISTGFGAGMVVNPEAGAAFNAGLSVADQITAGNASRIAFAPFSTFIPLTSETGKEIESLLDLIPSMVIMHGMGRLAKGDASAQNAIDIANKVRDGESITGQQAIELKNAAAQVKPEEIDRLHDAIDNSDKKTKGAIITEATEVASIPPEIDKQMQGLTNEQKLKVAPLIEQYDKIKVQMDEAHETLKPPFKAQLDELQQKISDIQNNISDENKNEPTPQDTVQPVSDDTNNVHADLTEEQLNSLTDEQRHNYETLKSEAPEELPGFINEVLKPVEENKPVESQAITKDEHNDLVNKLNRYNTLLASDKRTIGGNLKSQIDEQAKKYGYSTYLDSDGNLKAQTDEGKKVILRGERRTDEDIAAEKEVKAEKINALTRHPVDLHEWVLQKILGGLKLDPKDYERYTGLKGNDRIFSMFKNGGSTMEDLWRNAEDEHGAGNIPFRITENSHEFANEVSGIISGFDSVKDMWSSLLKGNESLGEEHSQQFAAIHEAAHGDNNDISALQAEYESTKKLFAESVNKGQTNLLGDDKVELFDQSGADTGIAKQKLDDIKAKIDQAKEELKTAESKVADAKKLDSSSSLFEQSKVLADKIRAGKIGSDVLMSGVPLLKEVINGAIEVAAKTIEAGGQLADAIKAGIEHLKSTDWYKGLTSSSDKAQAIAELKKNINDSLTAKQQTLGDLLDTPEPVSEQSGKRNVSFYTSLKDALTSNLNQLGKVSSGAKEAIVKFLSTPAQVATVIRKAGYTIAREIGDGNIKTGTERYEQLRDALIESVLTGKKQMWTDMADAASRLTPEDMQVLGSNDNLMGLLNGLKGRGEFDNPAKQTAILLMNGQPDLAKQYLIDTFNQASQSVAQHLSEEDYNNITAQPWFDKGLQLYKDNIEKPIASVHAANEGVFSKYLGNLNTYYPLIALDPEGKPAVNLGFGKKTPYRIPANPANKLATGLSEFYSSDVSDLGTRLMSAMKANNKAVALNELQARGIMKPFEKSGDNDHIEINGTVYNAKVVDVTLPKMIIQEGKPAVTAPSQKMVIPEFLYKEGKSVFDSAEPNDADWKKVLDGVNRIALGAWADAGFHSANLLGAIINGSPLAGTSIGSKIASGIPIVKQLTTVLNTVFEDVTSQEALKRIQEMSDKGLINPKVGTATWSQNVADLTGAKKVSVLPVGQLFRAIKNGDMSELKGLSFFNFSPILYGQRGIDIKARSMMYRIAQEINPEASNEEQRRFVNQLGDYTKGMSGSVERWLKENRVDPFATAHINFLKNSVKSLAGANPLPTEGLSGWKQGAWSGLRLVNSGMIGYLGVWALLYKAQTGTLPGAGSQIGKIPLTDDQKKWLDDNPAIKPIFYRNGKWQDVTMGLFNPMIQRGLKSTGIEKGINTVSAGGSPGQAVEASLAQASNIPLSVATGHPLTKAAFTALTGKYPYVTSLRDDMSGRQSPQFFPATATKEPGTQQLTNLIQGFESINPVVNTVAGSIGMSEKPADQSSDGLMDRFAQMGYDFMFPRSFSNSTDMDKLRLRLQKMEKATQTSIKKDEGETPVKATKTGMKSSMGDMKSEMNSTNGKIK